MGRNNKERRKAKKAEKTAKANLRKTLPVVQAVRPCDGCTVCCTVFGVEEINKPAWDSCPSLNERGCSIYETRPRHCRGFYCLYQHGIGTAMDRPDKLGVVFAPTNGKTEFTGQEEVQAYEVVPGAFARGDVVRLAQTFVDKGMLVIGHVHGGGKLRFMGPPDKVAKAERWGRKLAGNVE